MGALTVIDIDLEALRSTFGFGVAGNFTGHLEQAGEAGDFHNVAAAAAQPKGIFPWYVPGSEAFLGTWPLDAARLLVPDPDAAPGRIQIEPELGLYCEVERAEDGSVRTLRPRWAAAFDDCSLRRPNAPKISHKKNWGAGSKGLARRAFAVSDVASDGALESLRLACFLRRGSETHAYGVDSALVSYMLTGERLLDWLVERLHHQHGSDDTPLEDVGALLTESGATSVLVGVGASRYEPLGESTFVQPGDEAIVVVYDAEAHEPDQVTERIAARADEKLGAASILRRVAVTA